MQSGARWHCLDIAIVAMNVIVASDVTFECIFEAIDAIVTPCAHMSWLPTFAASLVLEKV